MPYDPSGVFRLVPSYFARPGETIRTDQHNPPFEDIESALSSVLVRDGRNGMVGPLSMGGSPIRNLGPGVELTDAISMGQVGAAFAARLAAASPKATLVGNDRLGIVDSQASNGFKAALLSSVRAYVYSDNLAGIPDKSSAFAAIKQQATDAATGVVEMATVVEAQAGEDTSRAVTPAGAKAASQKFTGSTAFSFVAAHIADQSISNTAAWTVISFGQVKENVGGAFNVSNSRVTPPAGPIFLSVSLLFHQLVMDSVYRLGIRKNGDDNDIRQCFDVAFGTYNRCLVVSLADTCSGSDYYEVVSQANGSGNRLIPNAPTFSVFEGFRR